MYCYSLLFCTIYYDLLTQIISKLGTVQWQCIILCHPPLLLRIKSIICHTPFIDICHHFFCFLFGNIIQFTDTRHLFRHILHPVSFCHLNWILLFLHKKACTYLISWTYADKLHTFSWHYKIKNEQQNWIYARLLLVWKLLYFSFSKKLNKKSYD